MIVILSLLLPLTYKAWKQDVRYPSIVNEDTVKESLGQHMKQSRKALENGVTEAPLTAACVPPFVFRA